MVASRRDLRVVKAVPDPIPWYIRAGFNDHKMLEDRLSAGDSRINRVVIDSAYVKRHETLIAALQSRRAELVLDPRIAEIAITESPGNTIQKLKWYKAANVEHADDFDQRRIQSVVTAIAEQVVSLGFSSVLAPTHFLEDENDDWIDIDAELTRALRAALNARGGRHVQIYYPMLVPYSWIATKGSMTDMASRLSSLPIDAVWLRVSNFKNDKSAAAVRNYIEGARALLSFDRPLIADHVGGVSALALLAVGAAGGIAHGIGAREGFTVSNWRRGASSSFSPGVRIYLAEADLYVKKSVLEPLLIDRVIRTNVACRNKACCTRGVSDMLSNDKIHMLNSRFDQIALVGNSIDSQRTSDFIRRALIPSGAHLIKLDHALEKHPDLQRQIQKKRRFVDTLRITLEDLVKESTPNIRRSRIPRRMPYRPAAASTTNTTRPIL